MYNSGMTRVVEAIYCDGVFEPLERMGLADKQRVRLIVETPENAEPSDRKAALDELFAEIDRMDLHLRVRMPTRDELYDRG